MAKKRSTDGIASLLMVLTESLVIVIYIESWLFPDASEAQNTIILFNKKINKTSDYWTKTRGWCIQERYIISKSRGSINPFGQLKYLFWNNQKQN